MPQLLDKVVEIPSIYMVKGCPGCPGCLFLLFYFLSVNEGDGVKFEHLPPFARVIHSRKTTEQIDVSRLGSKGVSSVGS